MNREKENGLMEPLKRRASTLSLNLRRVSASSFVSQRSGAPSNRGSIARLRDSFMPRARPSTANLISLPTPVNDSLEKFQSKLRAQRSLLSLRGNDDDSYGSQQRALYEELLTLCEQTEALAKPPRAADSNAVRVLDFGPSGVPLERVVQQLAVYKCAPAGFIQTRDAKVVGADPDLSLVHTLENTGTPLTELRLSSWTDAYLIFWQVVSSLSVAERRYQMEHRDLRPETIMVKRNPYTQRVEATISTLDHCRLRLASGTVVCSRLDSPHFFAGGERERGIYRQMQQLLMDVSPDKSNPQWDAFVPRTNVLWLHALVEYLLGSVQGPDHALRRSLQQTERRLRAKKRSILGSRDLESAGEVEEWGDRVLRRSLE